LGTLGNYASPYKDEVDLTQTLTLNGATVGTYNTSAVFNANDSTVQRNWSFLNSSTAASLNLLAFHGQTVTLQLSSALKAIAFDANNVGTSTVLPNDAGLSRSLKVSGAPLWWNNAGGGDGLTWTGAQNWAFSGTTPTPFVDGADSAVFNDINAGHYTVLIDPAGVTPGSTSVDAVGDYTISYTVSTVHLGGIAGTGALTKNGTGTLTLDTANTYTGATNVYGGTLTLTGIGSIASTSINILAGATLNINGAIATNAFITDVGAVNFGGNPTNSPMTRTLSRIDIASGASASVATSSYPFNPVVLNPATLNFADLTSKLDLRNNELLTAGSGAVAKGLIAAGKVFSSTLSVNTGLGYLDAPGGVAGQMEIRVTLLGDTDLDGSVGVGDLGVLATYYGVSGSMSWNQGDSNRDDMIDVADLGALATNYGTSLGGGTSADLTGAAASTATIAAAVPEPVAMTLLGFAAMLVTPRRQRRASRRFKSPPV
jgi:autotransporter-associated beta strand protein